MDSYVEALDKQRGCLNDFTSSNASRFCLNYVHMNARSIPAHIDEISLFLSSFDVQVLGVSETFLKRGMRAACFEINGYQIFRNDRMGAACGGVAIYISKGLKAKIIRRSEPAERIEFIFMELQLCGASILVGVFYVPPPTTQRDADTLYQILADISTDYSHIICMGDFNINIFDPRRSNIYLSTLKSLSLAYIPFNATRVDSLLDHMLIASCNASRVMRFAQSPIPGISDHDAIFLKYNHRIPKPAVNYIMIRDISNADWEAFNRNFYSISWNSLYTMSDCDEKIRFFSSAIYSLYNACVPLKRVLEKSPMAPWFNSKILHGMKKRDNAYAIWIANKNSSNRANFCRQRNIVVRLIRDSKRRYFFRKFGNVHNSQQAWSTLKNLGYTNKNKLECSLAPDELNNFFTKTPVTKPIIPLPFNCGYEERNGDFGFRNVSDIEVMQAIYTISSDAIGLDGISLKFVKLILPIILPHLTHVINYCIMTSHFPECWKQALVIPVPKTPSAFSSSDYRPISILPVLSKVLEILMRDQIQSYLDNNNLLTRCQSGFRKHHGTATALSKVSFDIMQNLNSSLVTILVLLDFTKAFDSIDHVLLGQKLYFEFNFSTQAVRLLISYLFDRVQAVKVGEKTSSFILVPTGVPQGSVLGPLLFSLYINTLPSAILNSQCHLYADDCQLYISGRLDNLNKTAELMNADLERIASWASKNGLVLNPKKSQAIMISQKRHDISLPSLVLNGIPILFVDQVKNLGVVFNKNLNWADHVTSICNKVCFALHTLRQLSFYTPIEIKRLLVRSLILPFFTYCDVLFFHPDYESARRLQVAFNSCTRYVHNLRKYDHVSAYSKTILGMSLMDYLEFRACCFIFKLIHVKHPSYLSSLVSFGSSPRTHNISSLCDRFACRQFSSSVFVYGFRLWNLLPLDVKLSGSRTAFKSSCFSFFKNR